jgi:hypothetical protein
MPHSTKMKTTKGDILRHALAYALRGLRLGRYPLGLTEADRFKVADDAIRTLRSAGQWCSLDEPAEEGPVGLTGPSKRIGG